MKFLLTASALTAVCLSGAAGAYAQILSNTITDADPSTANPYTNNQVVAANVTATGIGRGIGLVGSSAANRYSATSFNDVDLATSIAGSDYFTFTLTPTNTASLNFGNLTFTLQASGTGPTTFALLSSVSGFSSGNQIATATLAGNTVTLSVSDATLGANYDNVTSPIEFRLYGYGASSAAGTGSVNDFSFGGAVTVPEPSTYAMMAGAFGLLLLGQRVRRTARA